MAIFLTAYNKTAKNEGGYANDPVDRGGETWRGIARKIHPAWPGWKIVDSYKFKEDFIARLTKDQGLQILVIEFYKKNFWDKMRGDELENQGVADSIYDSAVNMGVATAIKLAQRALSIPETGKMDALTLKTLNNKE